MTGPLSGSNRPGEDDSWESLAEDLFGIDFHRGEANNLADDDDEDDDFEPITPPPAKETVSVREGEGDDDDQEAGFSEEDEAGFPEDDEAFVGAGFDDEEDDDFADEQPVEPEPPARRGAKPEPAAASSDEGDPFWDALNDWDWGDRTSPRKRPESAPAVEEERPTESPIKDDEGGRGRRGRRRGRGGRGRTERGEREPLPRAEGSSRSDTPRSEASRSEPPRPETPRSGAPSRPEPGSRAPQTPRQEPPRPLSKLVDDFEFEPPDAASSGDDDGFGAGLLDSDAPRHREPNRSRPAARREEGRERPSSDRDRPRSVDKPAERTPPAPAGRSTRSDEDEEVEGEEGQPRRRRRRRRRRSGEPAETVEQNEAGFPEAGFPEAEADERPAESPRRRERSGRPEPAGETAEAVADSRRAFRDVPTWAEAIALLVHRRPKQTTGWTPEPEDAERETQPSRPPQRRRRRRSS
ncbi:MAG: hypothetical protein M3552_01085 [Planctomycetota bacterium]|nr:hypothetical protein [Planctomycetota bacterium]